MSDPHLITVDDLRAAGVFDYPPAWKKSMSARMRDLAKEKEKDKDLPLFKMLEDDVANEAQTASLDESDVADESEFADEADD